MGAAITSPAPSITVTLGLYPSAFEYYEAMVRHEVDFRILTHENDCPLMEERKSPVDLDLVVCTFKDLDPNAPYPSAVDYLKAVPAAGLDFCPPEAAFALRLQHVDQPSKETIAIPVLNDQGDEILGCFYIAAAIAKDGKPLWFSYNKGSAEIKRWYSDTKLVFVRPRP